MPSISLSVPYDDLDVGNPRVPSLSPTRFYFGGFVRPPPRAEVERYMRGDCPYLALAFKTVHGFELVRTAGHVATRAGDGMLWDIRGRMDGIDFLDGLGDVPIMPTSRDEILDEMRMGILSHGPFVRSRLTRATALVRQMVPDAP